MLTIRKLLPSDDLFAVSKIYIESWRYAYKGMIPQQYLDSLSDGDWVQRLSKADRHILVAELDGKLIGAASYGESRTPENAGWGELYSIYLLPDYMGKGCGKQLMKAALSELTDLGYEEVFLWVLEDNIAARSFYEKMGLVCRGGIKEAEIGGKIVREICYEARLKVNYFYTTDRCGFAHWTESDLPLAYSLWGEPEVTRYICASGVFTAEDIKNRLHTEISNFEKYGVQYFPFYSLENDGLIGCCGLRPYKDTKNVYELGFHLRKEYWHKGYAIEAAATMIRYAFETLGAEELKAGHNPNNIASSKVLSKLGFQYECDEFYEPTGLNHPLYSLGKYKV